jgi:hypothetical protein
VVLGGHLIFVDEVAEEISTRLKECIKETNDANRTLASETKEKVEFESLKADIIRVRDEEIAAANDRAAIALGDLESRFQVVCGESVLPEEQEVEAGQCDICCDGKESIEFQPCNHRVCESCLDRLRTCDDGGQVICPWDRKQVDSIIRISE